MFGLTAGGAGFPPSTVSPQTTDKDDDNNDNDDKDAAPGQPKALLEDSLLEQGFPQRSAFSKRGLFANLVPWWIFLLPATQPLPYSKNTKPN